MNAEQLLGRIAENLSVRRAFGVPYEQDGFYVIPVALVAGGGGGGEGSGFPATRHPSHHEEQDESSDPKEQGPASNLSSGSGGGFGGVVVPLGVYVVKGGSLDFSDQ